MDEALSYQLLHLEELKRRCDLNGKSVLEIGGCLPRDVALGSTGARRWIGIDLPDYWKESGDENPSRFYQGTILDIDQAEQANDLDYALLLGDVLALPERIEPFDAVFSSCAFEHIQDLDKRLSVIRKILRPGSLLLAVAMPIWSSPHGSHMLPITDENGRIWHPESFALPDWHQLLLTPDEMAVHMTNRHIPDSIVRKAVHWVHESLYLNRLCAGDYVALAARSGFSEHRVLYSDRVDWADPQTMHVLETLYPGKGPFDRAGVMLTLHA
ncbi:MAG: methyltransferase domain-containing protein [Rhodospirillales bacterium]|nr:methyltransferase domain-containing protein [Rhodospirillales bacterium]